MKARLNFHPFMQTSLSRVALVLVSYCIPWPESCLSLVLSKRRKKAPGFSSFRESSMIVFVCVKIFVFAINSDTLLFPLLFRCWHISSCERGTTTRITKSKVRNAGCSPGIVGKGQNLHRKQEAREISETCRISFACFFIWQNVCYQKLWHHCCHCKLCWHSLYWRRLTWQTLWSRWEVCGLAPRDQQR